MKSSSKQPAVYATPALTTEDRGVLAEILLPERSIDAMFEAVLGYRVRRATYLKRTGVESQTATRDLAALAGSGVLIPHGTGRGRFYTAGEPLRQIQQSRRARRTPLTDPYPWMRPHLATAP